MTRDLQSTHEPSEIKWPAIRNHATCMAQVINLVIGAFRSSLGVKCRTKSWEAHACDQQFGDNETTVIAKSRRVRNEGNARIHKVLAMRPSLAKIIDRVCISRHFGRPETDLHIARNHCCIDYSDTWSSKRVHWLSKSQSKNRSTTCFVCENTVKFDAAVAWVSLLITRICPGVAHESKIQWLPATLHNTDWMDHRQVCHGSVEAILILDPVDVKKAYGNSASHYHSLQWHVQSYGWRYVSIS